MALLWFKYRDDSVNGSSASYCMKGRADSLMLAAVVRRRTDIGTPHTAQKFGESNAVHERWVPNVIGGVAVQLSLECTI